MDIFSFDILGRASEMDGASHAFTIFLVSDGTGDTGSRFLEAALHQFEAGKQTGVRKFPLVRTREEVDACLQAAQPIHPVILHTVVNEPLRQYLEERCVSEGLLHLDMLGPLFGLLSNLFGAPPKGHAGALHEVNQRYFQRIEAIEFTLRNDDGRSTRDLHRADIVLLGVSRTSKTPTSVFLAQMGYKVVNIPIVLNMPLPEELSRVEPRRVVGLTINPFRLAEIRRTRMQRMGAFEGDYADPISISLEVEYAESLFRRHRQWPVIDVTDRAIEETADQILNAVFGKERSLFR
jgi:hypothetical protein